MYTTFVNQLGLQRSGTNAVKALIECNCEDSYVMAELLGHKHKPIDWSQIGKAVAEEELADTFGRLGAQMLADEVRNKELRFVVSVKDPVSWLWSYFRYSRRKFLRRNPKARFELDDEYVRKALTAWKRNVSSWIPFVIEHETKSAIVQHEHLVQDPGRTLDQVVHKLDLKYLSNEPQLFLNGYAKAGGELHRGSEIIDSQLSFDRRYHLEGIWAEEMPSKYYAHATNFMNTFFRNNPTFRPFFDLSHLPRKSNSFR